MSKATIVLIFILYLVAINLLGIYLMGADKKKAKNGEWRIREAAFFLVSLIGGGIGCLIGMYCYRHKTKHISFLVGIPLCMVVGLALYGYVFYIFISLL